VERAELRKLLQQVRAGKASVEAALEQLRGAQLDRLAFATLDLARAVRTGFPEVVYGPGKTTEQIVGIVRRLAKAKQTVLVTRVEPEMAQAVLDEVPGAVHHALARAITLRTGRPSKGRKGVVVVTAGTADERVAEEAILVAELMGSAADRIVDVGVAGIHRLLEQRKALLRANVIVAVAGMEGALPSVIAGLVDCPVIGVPTSTGYGVGTGGEAALRSMLSSCSAGLTVVNIDNGFGAGYAAGLINRRVGTR
jgi:hypothetical protein